MDNPYNNPERGTEVAVDPITTQQAMDDAWKRLQLILEADPELLDVFKRMKEK